MTKPFEQNLNCKYGAPMGRPSTTPPAGAKATLERVPLSGDYDAGGAYWGSGEPLWCAHGYDFEAYFRADGRAMAVNHAEQVLRVVVLPEELPGLGEFFDGYVAAALWSSSDQSDDSGGEPLDANYDETDLSEGCAAKMLADCKAFLAANAEAIGDQYSQSGHDFWLTRVGAGAGFWDRSDDLYPGDNDALSEAAKAFGVFDLVVSDGKIFS